jgi:hypothetical protein
MIVRIWHLQKKKIAILLLAIRSYLTPSGNTFHGLNGLVIISKKSIQHSPFLFNFILLPQTK